MDRTIIAVQRAEERDLSEKLFKKLRGLGLLHPLTDDLRKCLNEEMFIKPNPVAFFHVMHYLFCLLDAVEFKKRFYWPITDKRSEANFRTSTVEYLKYLNEKHKLRWGDIKSYLVVMPGGKKFILFLLEFVAFIVQEQIRYREKILTAEVEAGQVTDLNLKRMQRQNTFFKAYASAYISNVEEQIVQLRHKTQQLNNLFDALARETGKNRTQICNDQFFVLFEKSNLELHQEKFVKKTEMMRKLEKPLVELNELMENFQLKEAEMKYDKGRVQQAIQKIGDVMPAGNKDNLEVFLHPTAKSLVDVNLSELIIAFTKIQPILENAFSEVEQTRSCGGLVTAELTALKNEFQQIETQITRFQMSLNSQIKERSSQRTEALRKINDECSSLMMKYVCTPPIKLEAMICGRLDNIRLPLFADIHSKFATDSFCGNISVLPRSARKHTTKDTSVEMNNTLNKSRIIDSMQLLRTIHKGTARVQRKTAQNTSLSTSLLSANWRERQSILRNDLESEAAVVSEKAIKTHNISEILNNSIDRSTDVTSGLYPSGQHCASTSPYTPFGSNERTRIARTQLLETISSSSGSGGTKAKAFYARRLSAVQKVQDDSLNIANMSTSPSGRLDPLVTAPVEYVESPILKLNDVTMEENEICFDKPDEHMTSVQVLEFSTRYILMTEGQEKSKSHEENDRNIINTAVRAQSTKCPKPLELAADEDDLFNISDTVLKDVTL
ncbi:augmin complex subunit dgt6 [Anastrepha ludens]|uniref:augmin complex subunit dgt6 n=1 Tax=Anastrepha ludens TaxID=28586 RepID=UPI0023B06F4E|nr:augmin complex subunit dgt6 [Anastrepha ludens]